MNQTYINAVRLLLAVAPVVFRKPLFALKGGTAINLFINPHFPALRSGHRLFQRPLHQKQFLCT